MGGFYFCDDIRVMRYLYKWDIEPLFVREECCIYNNDATLQCALELMKL